MKLGILGCSTDESIAATSEVGAWDGRLGVLMVGWLGVRLLLLGPLGWLTRPGWSLTSWPYSG